MSQEHSRTNGARFGGVYKEYLKIDREPFFPREERFFIKMNLIYGRSIKPIIAMDDRD